MIATTLFALTLATATFALPNGAPKCQIIPTAITNGHKTAASSLGNTFMVQSMTYTPGGPPIPVMIAGGQTFQGILVYATPGTTQDSTIAPNGVPQHVGTWAGAGLRAQTASACQAVGVMNDNAMSTVTQAAPLKNVGGANAPYVMMFTPPATDVGPVTLNAVLSVGTRNTPWGVVPSITLMPAAAAGAAAGGMAGAAAGAAGTAAGASTAAPVAAGGMTAAGAAAGGMAAGGATAASSAAVGGAAAASAPAAAATTKAQTTAAAAASTKAKAKTAATTTAAAVAANTAVAPLYATAAAAVPIDAAANVMMAMPTATAPAPAVVMPAMAGAAVPAAPVAVMPAAPAAPAMTAAPTATKKKNAAEAAITSFLAGLEAELRAGLAQIQLRRR
ncbi:hypothetical protein HK101_007096 [Irineochytrium annulatum]|nr:hypothetical protein HK101_007096 [Irineochytrium annulatum]